MKGYCVGSIDVGKDGNAAHATEPEEKMRCP